MIQAPRLPFDAPTALKPGGGIVDPDGATWCRECVPISIYYLGVGVRLPRGWRMIPSSRRRCCRCDQILRSAR